MSRRRASSFRIILGLVGITSVVTGPAWLSVIVMIMLSLRFRAWEVVLIGLATDLLWHPGPGILAPLPLFTIGAALLVWGLEPLRKQLLLTS